MSITMLFSEHGRILADAFEVVLGKAEPGAMAFVRCLTPDVVEGLADDSGFASSSWKIWRVASVNAPHARTITADQAVELRESKSDPVLLLVDTVQAA